MHIRVQITAGSLPSTYREYYGVPSRGLSCCLRVARLRKWTTGLKWTRPRILYPFGLNML